MPLRRGVWVDSPAHASLHILERHWTRHCLKLNCNWLLFVVRPSFLGGILYLSRANQKSSFETGWKMGIHSTVEFFRPLENFRLGNLKRVVFTSLKTHNCWNCLHIPFNFLQGSNSAWIVREVWTLKKFVIVAANECYSHRWGQCIKRRDTIIRGSTGSMQGITDEESRICLDTRRKKTPMMSENITNNAAAKWSASQQNFWRICFVGYFLRYSSRYW